MIVIPFKSILTLIDYDVIVKLFLNRKELWHPFEGWIWIHFIHNESTLKKQQQTNNNSIVNRMYFQRKLKSRLAKLDF